MNRVRMLVQTFHPDAGGARRQGEVFDLVPELAEHWVRQGIAEDATGHELSGPRAAEAEDPNVPWDDLPEPTLSGAVVNSSDGSGVARPRGLQKQRRP
jgi:hypothetical protein